MKKTKLLLPLLLSLTLVACGNNGGDSKKPGTSSKCKHNYEVVEGTQVAATCTEKGSHKEKCTNCGDEKEVSDKALGHDYVEQAGGTAATCEQPGTKVEKCSRCGDEKTTEIKALGHDWQDNPAKEGSATCTEAGKKWQKCSRCPAEQEVDTPALGHAFGDAQHVEGKDGAVSYDVQVCEKDGVKRYSWAANDVTDACNELVHVNNTVGHIIESEEAEGGYRFWGQPVGNSIHLNDQGRATQEDHVAIPDPNQAGDFFEFKFDSPEAVKDVKLRADITPSSSLNDVDMFAAPANVTSNDWTYGIRSSDHSKLDFDPNDSSTYEAIDDFRYDIIVNGERVIMDKATYEATPSRGRDWYDFPGVISLKKGVNTIRIGMAGGWLHAFHKFGVEVGESTEPEPVMTIDYDTVRESMKTAAFNVTGDTTGYTLADKVLTISKVGEYKVSGYFNGQILITGDAAGCSLKLHDAFIEWDGSASEYPIFFDGAKGTKMTIILDSGTTNYVIGTGSAAAIYSKRDITIQGMGANNEKLYAVGNTQHGIKAKNLVLNNCHEAYFQGTADGSAINCETLTDDHTSQMMDIYCINSKNGVKADTSINLERVKFHLFDLATGLKTDEPEDETDTTDYSITLGTETSIEHKQVETLMSSPRIDNKGKVTELQ